MGRGEARGGVHAMATMRGISEPGEGSGWQLARTLAPPRLGRVHGVPHAQGGQAWPPWIVHETQGRLQPPRQPLRQWKREVFGAFQKVRHGVMLMCVGRRSALVQC